MSDSTDTEQLKRRLKELRKLHHQFWDEAIWGGGGFGKVWEARGVAKEAEVVIKTPPANIGAIQAGLKSLPTLISPVVRTVLPLEFGSAPGLPDTFGGGNDDRK